MKTWYPSTIASGIQSLADPSTNARHKAIMAREIVRLFSHGV
ncbi:hypothetical protein ACEQPO_15020 [Bacillus sp. SL00103]